MRTTGLIAFACLLVAEGMAAAQNHTIVVLNHNDFTISELDPVSGKTLHQFKTANQPHEAAITPDGETVFAAIPEGPHVVILDAATFTEKGKIESEYFKRTPQTVPGARGRPPRQNTSARPHGVALSSDGSKLYITVEDADIPGVVVYDVRSRKIVKKLDLLLRGGHYLQIQPGTDKLYFPHRGDDRVVVIDTKTDKVLKIIPIAGGPVGVAFSPNGEVWFHQDGNGTVAVVDSTTDEVVKVIQTGARGGGRVAVSPDGRWAASTHDESEDVTLIDAVKKEVVGSVRTGRGPGFPIFSPDNAYLYIMYLGEDAVYVLDVRDLRITARHRVGDGPFGGGLRFPGRRSSR